MAAGARRSSIKTAVQVRISLMEHTPTIWRRLLVPGEIKLSKLHMIFQAAMGWEDYHLHYFEIDGQRYGIPDEDFETEDIDDEEVTFVDVIKAPMRFFYEYDFGDSWRHEVVVESVDLVPLMLKFAICLDGQRACPPEDCGGTGGYEDSSRLLPIPSTTSTTTTSDGSAGISILSCSAWPRTMRRCSGCAESGRLLRRPLGLGRAQSEALGPGLDDVGVECQPIDDGGDQAGITDDLTPFGEGEVRGGGHRCLLLAFGQDLEQQLSSFGVELDIAELVEAEQVEAPKTSNQSRQPAFVCCFGQFVDQGGAGDIAHSLALFTGRHAKADEQMALAGPAGTEEDDRITGPRGTRR